VAPLTPISQRLKEFAEWSQQQAQVPSEAQAPQALHGGVRAVGGAALEAAGPAPPNAGGGSASPAAAGPGRGGAGAAPQSASPRTPGRMLRSDPAFWFDASEGPGSGGGVRSEGDPFAAPMPRGPLVLDSPVGLRAAAAPALGGSAEGGDGGDGGSPLVALLRGPSLGPLLAQPSLNQPLLSQPLPAEPGGSPAVGAARMEAAARGRARGEGEGEGGGGEGEGGWLSRALGGV
jgi:hypothetical protein